MKICLIDFWKNVLNDPVWIHFFSIIFKYDELVSQAKDADIILCSVFGDEYKKYIESKKLIFWTGENYRRRRPNYDDYNLLLTFDRADDYKNFRMPLWITSKQAIEMIKTDRSFKPKKKFCIYVASGNREHRNNFVIELSKYKKVDCAGACLNNMQRIPLGNNKIMNKMNFIKDNGYKFCVAFENTDQPGYCTEKIIEAFAGLCIPIYRGDVTVTLDFNPKTFINAHDFDSNERLIEYIKYVDSNDEVYKSYFKENIYSPFYAPQIEKYNLYCTKITYLMRSTVIKNYVINLKRRPDRLQEFFDRIPFFKQSISVFEAIDGKQSESINESLFVNENIRCGAKGCAQSHYELWEKMVNEQIPYMIIFEDDCFFYESFMDNIDYVLNNIPSNSIIHLDDHIKNVEEITLKTKTNLNLMKIRKWTGTPSYIITLDAANNLLNFHKKNKFHRAVDWWIVEAGNKNIINRYSVSDSLTYHIFKYKSDIFC